MRGPVAKARLSLRAPALLVHLQPVHVGKHLVAHVAEQLRSLALPLVHLHTTAAGACTSAAGACSTISISTSISIPISIGIRFRSVAVAIYSFSFSSSRVRVSTHVNRLRFLLLLLLLLLMLLRSLVRRAIMPMRGRLFDFDVSVRSSFPYFSLLHRSRFLRRSCRWRSRLSFSSLLRSLSLSLLRGRGHI